MRTIIGPLLLAAALLACAPRPLRAQGGDEEREAPRVVKLDFTGNEAFGDGMLEDAVATETSRCKSILVQPICWVSKSPLFYERNYLDRTELRRDILRLRVFYWRQGWRETQVDTVVARKGEGVAVTFRITEGEPTRVASVRVRQAGDSAVLSDDEIERAMMLRAGEPASLVALDSSVTLLKQALADEGYADAVVRSDTMVVDSARRAAAVAITLEPRWLTRIGEVVIAGNARVSDRTIRRSLTMRPGDVYRRQEILRSQRNLYESNLFRHAAIVIPPKGDSLKTIEVAVREAPFNETRASLGFNTVDFVQTEGRYTRYNFLGGARRLDLRAVVGNILAPQLNGSGIFQDIAENMTETERNSFLRPTWQLSAAFTQPWAGSAANSFGLDAFAHRRTIPRVVIDRGFGASASFTRQVMERAPLSAVYRFETTEIEASDVYFCVNFGVCERATISALRGRRELSPFALSFFTDRTDDLFFPTRGWTVRADAEHASGVTFSDFRYNRVSGEGSRYWAVGERRVIAAHVRGGWVRALPGVAEAVGLRDVANELALIHPRKRFYAGGSQSVRGFGENQLGPLVLTVDPQRLRDSVEVDGVMQPGCTDASIADASCDPSAVPSDEFTPRPTGGTALAEASVEYRFPIWRELGGALFLDGAFVGSGGLADVAKGNGALTPGFGVRYYTVAGAIRVDIGWRPSLTENLAVITQVEAPGQERRIVQLATPKSYSPVRGFWDHLTLHLSLGQAF
jgi:outer membrane protein insertion porin family/translocation and assembly module TamA